MIDCRSPPILKDESTVFPSIDDMAVAIGGEMVPAKLLLFCVSLSPFGSVTLILLFMILRVTGSTPSVASKEISQYQTRLSPIN